MIACIQSAIAGAFAFSTSVGLHERMTDTHGAPAPVRALFDLAGVVALANAVASLSAPPSLAGNLGALIMLALAVLAWRVAITGRTP